MKKLLSYLIVTMLLATAVPPVRAAERLSLDFFYENLDGYGVWREVGDYGYCWQPSDVEEGWRPYSDGRWVYTDAGWTWDSDEPFGWAVYHYGRWADVENVGWIWVPDTEWAPAWVSWRRSPAYVGWAPLPPEAHFRITLGFSSWVDDYYDIGPGSYCFVSTRNFGARRLRSVCVDRRENITIISQTTNITNITYVNNVVHNEGPRYEVLSRESEQPIGRYKLDRRQSFEGDERSTGPEPLKSRVQGETLSVFAPPLVAGSQAAPKKLAPRVADAAVNRGWRNAGSPSEVTELRSKLKGQTKTPAELPPQARFQGRGEEVPTARVQPGDLPPAPDSKRKSVDQPPTVNPAKVAHDGKPRVSGESGKSGKGAMLPKATAAGDDKPRGSVGPAKPAKEESIPKARALDEAPASPGHEKASKNKKNTNGDAPPAGSKGNSQSTGGINAPVERPPGAANSGKGPSRAEETPPVHKKGSDKVEKRPQPAPKKSETAPEPNIFDLRPQSPAAVQQAPSDGNKSNSKAKGKEKEKDEDKKPGKAPK